MNQAGTAVGGLPGESLVELGVGIGSFLMVFALYRALFPAGSITARARLYAKRRRENRTASRLGAKAARRQKSVGMIRRLLERLKLTKGAEVRKTAELLTQAGWRTPDALTVFLGIRLGMPIVMGTLAYLGAPTVAPHILPITRLFVAFVGIAVGAYGPTYFAKNAAQKRRRKVEIGLSDALDLFVICAEAGLGLDTAINRVGKEIARNAPELADELKLTGLELAFLPNRRDALNNLMKRVDIAPIRNLVTTLTQTERYGTPLAQSLRVLATEFRNARMMRAEEKAARLPAVLTVPMIIFILPPLFTVLVGPAIIQVLNQLH
ncbi:MAG TPA: type II secretion system F family protein [Alphaproteobacteria bacterium]|jgi:tight adherence protein C|nr:type II secretion system F family protein [Alphaproteobacteria bacterium]